MPRLPAILSAAAVLLCACLAGHAAAQTYPVRPVKVVAPFAPGGSNDIFGRVIAAQLTDKLGQTVFIDNRPGAGGTVGTDAVAKAPADGYTLLLISAAYSMNAAIAKLPYDPINAFTPIAMLGTGPAVLTVPSSLHVHSVRELIDLAKSKPGQLNVGSAGIGSFQHLVTELFKQMTRTDMQLVQYRGGGPALTDLVAGRVDLSFGSLIQTLPFIRSGHLRALGVGGSKRNPAIPDIPTIAEAGVPGYEANNWWGMVAPSGTPAPVIERLNRELATILRSRELSEKFETEGAEVLQMSADQFRDFMNAETAKWVKVAREANIRLD
jgi:tripartite-type tricarboxylate transporter receptor subunit TctC